MKKLMIAAVAMAAGALFAEDITSKNIVGYMNNDETVGGLNLLGAGFQDVGYTSVKLNSLKVTNKDGGKVSTGKCSIQTINGLGVGIAQYDWKKSGKAASAPYKWYNGSTAVDDSVIFARGYGLLFTAENANDILASNGDVDLSACTNGTTIVGLNVIANPYPTSVKVNELIVLNKDGGKVSTGKCSIQQIDGLGVGSAQYDWKKSGKASTAPYKWYNGSTQVGDDVLLDAGSAVLFTAENAGDMLIFPAK